jgi:hypothetical protein
MICDQFCICERCSMAKGLEHRQADMRMGRDWDNVEAGVRSGCACVACKRTREILGAYARVEANVAAGILKIETDSRFRDKPALVQVNAPLALIQVEMKARHQALSEVAKWASTG